MASGFSVDSAFSVADSGVGLVGVGDSPRDIPLARLTMVDFRSVNPFNASSPAIVASCRAPW